MQDWSPEDAESHAFRAKRVGQAVLRALEENALGVLLLEDRGQAPPISEDPDLESVWVVVGLAALDQALEEGWRKPTAPYGEPEAADRQPSPLPGDAAG